MGNTVRVGSFRKAVRRQAKLRLGIAGPAGSGKTYTALLLAFGMGGKVAMVDTEHGSGDLYAELGDYDTCRLDPPYTPERYISLITEAEKEYDVLIVDSLSHAWAGTGGVLDILNKVVQSSRSGNSYAAWREVTPMHNALVEKILTCESHIICTVRSKMAYAMDDDGTGKHSVRPVGMAPVQRDGMMYEFTIFMDLSIEHVATAVKDRTQLFPVDQPFIPDSDTGIKIMAWLEQGEPPEKEILLAKADIMAEIPKYATVSDLNALYKKIAKSVDALESGDKELVLAEFKAHKQKLLAPKKETKE